MSSRGISPAKLKRMIKDMSPERQRESIERGLRVVPIWIMEECAKTGPQFNSKVVAYLEKTLKVYRECWTDYLIEFHVKGDHNA